MSKKKESWKEKRRRAALKREKALEAERIRREREPKKKRRGWPRGKFFGVICVVALLLISYGVWQYTQSSTERPSPEGAPLFTLTDIDGVEFSLGDFIGRVVVLDFFYIRCPPCREEIPELAQVYGKYSRSDVVIISISVDPDYDTIERLQKFREEHQISWTIAGDTASVSDKYNVQAVPTLVIIDQSGVIYYRNVGLTYASTLSSKIDSLLDR